MSKVQFLDSDSAVFTVDKSGNNSDMLVSKPELASTEPAKKTLKRRNQAIYVEDE